MDKLEELLPGIDKFLTQTLAKEKLSDLAERQRQYYIERLDIIQLPPQIPPKPDGEKSTGMQGRKLPEPQPPQVPPPRNSSSDDFISKQRMISRQEAPTQLPSQDSVEYDSIDNHVPNNGEGLDSDQYEEGLYEEPIPMDDRVSYTNQISKNSGNYDDAVPAVDSDVDSSTSYESYEDEPYSNVTADGQVKPDIPLPRIKSKRKKKAAVVTSERYYKQLSNIVYEGEIYHRGKIAFTTAWTKRYCVICDGLLFCYNKDKESKPIFSIPLLGYDVIILEKEKGRSNVVRLSHPGCETHFLSSDTVSETRIWMSKLETACNTAPDLNAADTTSSSSLSHYHTGSQSSMETCAADTLSNSSPNPLSRKASQTLSSERKEKKGKITKFLSETFGKKKGQRVAQTLEITGGSLMDSKLLSSPDISIAGIVKLSTDLLSDNTWQYKQCAIRNGVFECVRDDSTSSDLEFSINLTECELQTNGTDSGRPLALCVNKSGETVFKIEPENRLDHGSWLSALLKHVGRGEAGASLEDFESLDDYTYVGADSIPHPHQKKQSEASEPDAHTPEERQYADLSDLENDEEDDTKLVVAYDDPCDEPSASSNSNSSARVSQLYEEVADGPASSSDEVQKTRAEDCSKSPSRLNAPGNKGSKAESRQARSLSPGKRGTQATEVKDREEQTPNAYSPKLDRPSRTDIEPKASQLLSPTTTDGRSSRESSCSSDAGNKRFGDNIAKHRAMFENNNNATNNKEKWTGFKLASAAAPVNRTSSNGSHSTRSSVNSANTSPQVSRSSSSVSNSDKSDRVEKTPVSIHKEAATIPSIDKAKAMFEANNNTVEKSSHAKTKIKGLPPASPHETQMRKKSGRISPIRLSEDRTTGTSNGPKITSIFTGKSNASTSGGNSLTVTNARRFDIKSKSQSPTSTKPSTSFSSRYSSNMSSRTTSSGKSITVTLDVNRVKTTSDCERKSCTLPNHSATLSTNNANIVKSEARIVLTSALQKFAALEASGALPSSLSSGAISSQTEVGEKKRLDDLRQSLTNLRKERQKIRDQKLSTVLPEDREQLDTEYKRIDAEYKTIQREITVLEENNLRRIKDSIERRKSLAATERLADKKKMWESSAQGS